VLGDSLDIGHWSFWNSGRAQAPFTKLDPGCWWSASTRRWGERTREPWINLGDPALKVRGPACGAASTPNSPTRQANPMRSAGALRFDGRVLTHWDFFGTWTLVIGPSDRREALLSLQGVFNRYTVTTLVNIDQNDFLTVTLPVTNRYKPLHGSLQSLHRPSFPLSNLKFQIRSSSTLYKPGLTWIRHLGRAPAPWICLDCTSWPCANTRAPAPSIRLDSRPCGVRTSPTAATSKRPGPYGQTPPSLRFHGSSDSADSPPIMKFQI
jgi:hypothetical protein